MATGKVTPAPGGVAEVGNLLQMLGGTKETSTSTQSPADIAGLQALMAQLQGADYNAQLQSIFQTAAGAIPGLQSAYGRAVGARSSNNTAVQAALNELLKATTVEAQGKIANQQLQNQQIQAQAGQAVAQATKGTTQTQTTKQGTNVPKAAGSLAVLEALARLSSNKTVQDMVGKVTGGVVGTAPAAAAAPVGTNVAPQAAAPIASAPAMQPTAAPQPVAAQPMAPVQAVQAPMQTPVMMAPAPVYTPPEVFTPVFAEDFGYVPTPAPEFAPIFAEDFGFEG
jgi:hypothetical protein